MRTSIRTAIKAKREGMRKGVPDLFVPKWKLWIEFKRSKGGTVSPEQKEWHEYLEDHCGDIVIIARGCDDGVKKVMALTHNL